MKTTKEFLKRCWGDVYSKSYIASVSCGSMRTNFSSLPMWDGEARRTEQWRSGRTNNREVYVRVMKADKPDEILQCRHFAFRTQYKHFGRSVVFAD